MQIERKNYTKQYRFYSDNINEYSVVLDKSLSVEAFTNFLNANGIQLYGMITFAKKLLTFANGKKQYKHIAYCAMSTN